MNTPLTSLFLLLLVPLLFGNPSKHASTFSAVDSAKAPHMVFDTLDADLGKIVAGSSAEHTYVLRNTGTAELKIARVISSCGCTAALLDDSTIQPQHESRIHAKFDSQSKGLGAIVKTITVQSNDPNAPSLKLSFHLVIIPEDTIKAHAGLSRGSGMMHLDGVFKGNCASCHADKGKGLYGMELWNADCAICHGSPSDGKPGPALTSVALMTHASKEWKSIIATGLPRTNMPAFAQKKGGPLDVKEIASLVEYISEVKKQLTAAEQGQGGNGPK